jgi:hypothetical protein
MTDYKWICYVDICFSLGNTITLCITYHEFDFYLFRNLTKDNDQYMFWKENVPLSYSRMRELFIQAVKQFVSDIKFYGLHC